jgi:hypothetical protein
VFEDDIVVVVVVGRSLDFRRLDFRHLIFVDFFITNRRRTNPTRLPPSSSGKAVSAAASASTDIGKILQHDVSVTLSVSDATSAVGSKSAVPSFSPLSSLSSSSLLLLEFGFINILGGP